MNTIGIKVKSKAYGVGMIVDLNGKYLTVKFDSEEKKFQFPEAFKLHLSTDDKELMNYVKLSLVENEKIEKQKLLLKEEQNKNKFPLANEKACRTSHLPHKKKYPKENIAFKCNFCNGGSTDDRIGFRGVCSDELIQYNILVAKRTWCSSDESDCRRYLSGEISREELDDFINYEFGVCYESQMLNCWTAFAGITQNGDRKGTPKKLNQVQAHSLCILTTREPDMVELDRYIFAAFLVDETFEGDLRDEGYVTTNSKYKIELTPKEARSMKFWRYHSNKNQPEIAAWNTGLHRYFDDEEAAQILKDIYQIKKGTKDEELACDFFKDFCRLNNVDDEKVSNPKGILK